MTVKNFSTRHAFLTGLDGMAGRALHLPAKRQRICKMRNNRIFRTGFILGSALLTALSGCASPNISLFASGTPSMAPPDWMAGTVDGYGIIVDRFGNVKSQFHAHETGDWNAAKQTLVLTEHITYLQGSSTPPTERVWHFTETAPGQWTGTAADVIGTATAEQAGNAWHLCYRQKLPIGGNQVEVSVDDWRLREAGNVAIDHSTISKLGIQLATAEIAFIKSD